MKLLSDDIEIELEDLQRGRALREELSLLGDDLELFSHPSWGLFSARIQSLIDKDMDALVNCPLEEVPSVRARIKAHRHLLGLEQELRGREADIRRALAGLEEEDDQ